MKYRVLLIEGVCRAQRKGLFTWVDVRKYSSGLPVTYITLEEAYDDIERNIQSNVWRRPAIQENIRTEATSYIHLSDKDLLETLLTYSIRYITGPQQEKDKAVYDEVKLEALRRLSQASHFRKGYGKS